MSNPANPPKDGGPAYPTERHEGLSSPVQYPGMSLRDWFAGQALVCVGNDTDYSPNSMARSAYQIADAMLAERAKEPTND